MTATKKIKTREELRVEVVKKITANKRNAQSFLKKAGIVSKSGELSKIYRLKKHYTHVVIILLLAFMVVINQLQIR